HCFRTNTVSGLAKAGCLVAFSLTLFVPGFGDIRKLCLGARAQSLQTLAIQSPLIRRMFIDPLTSIFPTTLEMPRPCKRENLKLGAKRSTGKFAGKVPGKFTGDNPAIDLNPALDSVGPNSPTLRTRTVRVLGGRRLKRVPTPYIYKTLSSLGRNVDGPETDVDGPDSLVGLHTDVRVCPSAHTGRPWPSVSTHRTSGCPSVHISARSVDLHTGRPSAHTGRPSAHAGRPSAHAGRPWLSVCPSAHAGRPSVHTGRPSAHKGRPSAHSGRPWLSVCVRVSVSTHRTSLSTHRTSVSTHRTSVAFRQYTQDVRDRPSVHISACWPFLWTVRDVRQHTQDVRACPLAHTNCPWTDPCTELISACCQYTYQHAGPSPCWPFTWTVRVLIRVLIRILNSYQHADHTYQHAGPSRVLIRILNSYQHADHTYQHAGPSRGLSVY
ncbi:hypothetical protein IGI04_035106, partial [Brassica rapa subsp. trilocularis]